MRRLLIALVLAWTCAATATVASSAAAIAAHRTGWASGSVSIRTAAGPGTSRLEVAEPAGVIRLFRIAAPAGTRVKVTGEIPGLAGVSTVVPALRDDPAEACSRQGRSVTCVQEEEACPMPSAIWVFRVRKLAGPAGRIRIDFSVGRAASGRQG